MKVSSVLAHCVGLLLVVKLIKVNVRGGSCRAVCGGQQISEEDVYEERK